MSKKRLLIVTHLYPYPGNIYLGTFVIQQLRVLKTYFDITVLTVFPASLQLRKRWPAYSRYENGLHIISLPHFPFWIQGLGLLGIPTSARMYINKKITRHHLHQVAKRLHDIEHFDLVHGHETYVGDEAGPIGQLLGIPSVFTLHSFFYYHKKLFGIPAIRLALKNLQLCNQYIGVSSVAAESYIKKGLSPDKFSIIPNGINVPQKGRPNNLILNFAKGRKVLLSVGNLSDVKKFDVSIRAFAQLPDQETVLVIVGIGPRKKKLQNLSESLHCADRILWLGAIEPSLMSEVYRAIDILIHPSVVDSFSMVCLEAMAHGKVVICTTLIGICEFTNSGNNIITVQPNNISAFVSAIQWLFDHPDEYRYISSNASSLAATMSWGHQVDRINQVYSQLLS